MFESAKLKHHVSPVAFKREEKKLREALLEAQIDLLEQRKFPVLILIAGVEGAGKGETVNLLNEWMDPRHIHTHGFRQPSDEERERPRMWRFWRALPPKGKIGILLAHGIRSRYSTASTGARARASSAGRLRTSRASRRC